MPRLIIHQTFTHLLTRRKKMIQIIYRLINKDYYNSTDIHTLKEIIVLNKLIITSVSLIVLASSFVSPAYSGSSRAVIVNMHNKVQAKTQSNPVWQMAHIDKNLDGGDSIRTGVGSRAEIKYSDGTVTRLGSNSLMRVSLNSQTKRTGIRLLLGKLWLKVTRGNGELKVETPTAIASVLGTELLVTNDDKNISHVTTLDGLVEVTGNQGDKTLVKPGEWVEIVPGQQMEKPTPFDWASLKKNERFMLDPTFVPSPDDFKDDSSWR